MALLVGVWNTHFFSALVGDGMVNLALIIVFGLLYTYNLSPGLPWLDSGELIAAAHSLGFSHPPTHPFYALCSHALSYLLPGTIAYRYNAISMLFALATLLIMRKLVLVMLENIRSHPDNRIIAVFVTAMFGLNPNFFIQALRAEVYPLEFLIIVTVAYLLLPTFMGKKPPALAESGSVLERRYYTAALLLGLGVAVHPMRLGIYLPFVLLLSVGCLRWQRLFIGLGYFSIGAVPFIYHWVREQAGVKMAWGHFQHFDDWFAVLTGSAQRYKATMPTSASLLHDCFEVARLVVVDSCWPILLLGIGGIMLMLKRNRRAGLACSWVLLTVLAMMTTLMQLTYTMNGATNPDISAILAPVILFLLLAAAVALQALGLRTERKYVRHYAPGILLLLIIVQFFSLLSYGGLRQSYFAERFITRLEQTLPEGALFFATSDYLIPFAYIQYCEKRRADVVSIVLLEMGSREKYAYRRRFDPEVFPELAELKQRMFPELLQFELKGTRVPHFLTEVLQFNRHQRPIFFDPQILNSFNLDVHQLNRVGVFLTLSPADSRGVVNELLTDENDYLAATSILDRFAHAVFMEQIFTSLANFHYQRKELDQTFNFNEAALKFQPRNPTLLNNRKALLNSL
jgi:hypothetical protein